MKEINSIKQLNEEIMNHLTVVDVWAPWCNPCKTLMPILEELEKELSDVNFVKVNVDDNPDIMTEYNIRAVPTLLFISQGTIKETLSGVPTIGTLKETIERIS